MRSRATDFVWIGLVVCGMVTSCGGSGSAARPAEAPSGKGEAAAVTEVTLPTAKELSNAEASEKSEPAEVAEDEPVEPATVPPVRIKEERYEEIEGGVEGGVLSGSVGGVVGGVQGGVYGGVPGGVYGGVPGGVVGSPRSTNDPNAVIPFGPGMNRPIKISGPDPGYTKQAIDARVQGVVVVKCTVKKDGRTENCRMIKSLPLLGDIVMAAMKISRYTPVILGGAAVNVDYTFFTSFELPNASAPRPTAPKP